MKKMLFLLVVITGIVACNNNDDNSTIVNSSVVGAWALSEVLADPGDGSGTFQPVDSDKALQFSSNGQVTSNGNICSMYTNTEVATTGTYSDESHTITGNCGVAAYPITYEITAEGNLILNHPCIEACREKYVRLIQD